LSRSIGRFKSRAVEPTAGAITAIVSPGVRHTASYSRSLNAPISSAARRAPCRDRDDVGHGGVEREGLAVALEPVANARLSAACAAARVAEMYSSTRCSMRLQRSWGFVGLVMDDEFARTEIASQFLP
jgi:hypothetical protein